LREQFGNGLATNYTYSTTGRLRTTQTGSAADPKRIHAASFEFDLIGNLMGRSNDIQNLSEKFNYDQLNRLLDSSINGQLRLTMEYDALGNIKRKSDVGNYTYGERGAGVHAVTSISGFRNQSYEYDANGNRTKHNGGDITYTSYNMPVRLREGNTEVVFLHSPDHARYFKTVGNSGVVTTTHYIGGLYETETANGVTTQRHYLNNGSTFAVYTTQASKPAQTRYLHKDHLGSTEAISDDNGALAERLSFDAWGARRDPSTWASTTGLGRNSSNRGFTGHEPLDELGLVHMNGRVYDPLIGRFISADPFIQFEDNSQSLNRYSYVLNGPLSFTDPSGFFLSGIKKFIGNHWKAIVAIAITIAFTWAAGIALTAIGFAKATVLIVSGFIGGFAGGYIGARLNGASGSSALRAGFISGLLSAANPSGTNLSDFIKTVKESFASITNFGKAVWNWGANQALIHLQQKYIIFPVTQKLGLTIDEFNLILTGLSYAGNVIAGSRMCNEVGSCRDEMDALSQTAEGTNSKGYHDPNKFIKGVFNRGLKGSLFDIVDHTLGMQGLMSATAMKAFRSWGVGASGVAGHSEGALDIAILGRNGLISSGVANSLPGFFIASPNVTVHDGSGDLVNFFSLGAFLNNSTPIDVPFLHHSRGCYSIGGGGCNYMFFGGGTKGKIMY